MTKRKTKNAIKMLNEIINTKEIKSYYRGIAYIYKAYGNMTQHSFSV